MVSPTELLEIPAARGRRSQLSIEKRRDMVASDVEALATAKPLEQVTPVSQLRHQHHLLARLIAEGKSLTEAGMITGYSVTYISRLKTQDKAFQELIAYYQSNVEEIYYSVHEILKGLGLNTVQELMARLADDPDSFRNRELMEIAAMALDRAGFGPVQTTKHSIAGLSPEDIAAMKAAIEARSSGTIKLISPNDSRANRGTIIEQDPAPSGAHERLPSQGNDFSADCWTVPREGGPL